MGFGITSAFRRARTVIFTQVLDHVDPATGPEAAFHVLHDGKKVPFRTPPTVFSRSEIRKAADECAHIIMSTVSLGTVYHEDKPPQISFRRLPEAIANWREYKAALKAIDKKQQQAMPLGIGPR